MCLVNSGVTSHREISADLPGKEGQGKRGKLKGTPRRSGRPSTFPNAPLESANNKGKDNKNKTQYIASDPIYTYLGPVCP